MAATPSPAETYPKNHRHVISCLVENKSGVLARISGMFSARGYNIDSLTVGETLEASVSRMTIVTRGDDRIIEQIIKQLRKLIDVIRVADLSEKTHVERELVLIKVQTDKKSRAEILQVTEIFRGRIVDVGHSTTIIECVGNEDKIAAIIDMFRPYGILELSRTGSIAMFRKEETLKLPGA